MLPSRNDAWTLLCEFTQNENLRKHALAVEACVRAYARKSGADEELWGLAALLHDFDYERCPNQEHHSTARHARCRPLPRPRTQELAVPSRAAWRLALVLPPCSSRCFHTKSTSKDKNGVKCASKA